MCQYMNTICQYVNTQSHKEELCMLQLLLCVHRSASSGSRSSCSIYHLRTSIQLVSAGCCRSSSGSSHHAHGLMDACGRRAGRGAGQQHGSGRPPMAMHACAYSSAHTVVIYHAPPRTGRPASSVAGGGRRRAEDDDKRKPPRRTYSRLVEQLGCRCRPAREITHSAWTHAVNRHAAAVVLQLASSLRFFCFAWLVGQRPRRIFSVPAQPRHAGRGRRRRPVHHS